MCCLFTSVWLQLRTVVVEGHMTSRTERTFSVLLHPLIESSMGQVGHVLCGTSFIMCSSLLMPSVPVLHLSMVAFMLSVMFGSVGMRRCAHVFTVPIG